MKLVPADAQVPFLPGPWGHRWIAGAATHGCWLGTYERTKRRKFQNALRPGQVVYDVGANVGFYTLLASVAIGDGGRVMAIEPHPTNVRLLRAHLTINRANNVSVLQAAAWSVTGKVQFMDGPNRSQGTVGSFAHNAEAVDAIALDDMAFRPGFRPPSLMKIDVEGAEFEVLVGATKILEVVRPALFLATHSRELHFRCCDFLGGLHYELQAIDGTRVEETSELLGTPAPMPGR